MNRMLIVIGLVAALAIPASALATHSHTAKRAAVAECKFERGKSHATHEAFKIKYHSFSRCVDKNTVEEKAETELAHKNAAKECKAEREQGLTAFQDKYGTNANKKNAFGKCVSQLAKAKKDELDAKDKQEAEDRKDAAKACAAERAAGLDAFREKYGTNANKKNAFGKCVSTTVRDDHADDEESPEDS
jgi:hypothetical protein